MAHRRDRDQIIAKILEVCKDTGACKTKIIYKSNMSFNTIQPYLEALVRDKLIEVDDQGLYKTTKEGNEILAHLKAIRAMMPEFE